MKTEQLPKDIQEQIERIRQMHKELRTIEIKHNDPEPCEVKDPIDVIRGALDDLIAGTTVALEDAKQTRIMSVQVDRMSWELLRAYGLRLAKTFQHQTVNDERTIWLLLHSELEGIVKRDLDTDTFAKLMQEASKQIDEEIKRGEWEV